MAAPTKKAPKAVANAVNHGRSTAVVARAARAGATGELASAKPRARGDAVTAKARRVDAVKRKIKAQVAGLDTTREARRTRVKAAVGAVRAKRATRRAKGRATGSAAVASTRSKSTGASIAKGRSPRAADGTSRIAKSRPSASSLPTSSGAPVAKPARRASPAPARGELPIAVAKTPKQVGRRTGSRTTGAIGRTTGSNKAVANAVVAAAVVSLPAPKPRPTRIKAAVAAVKAKLVKGRRVASTEEREAAALAIADAHEVATPTAANENAPTTSTLTTAPLATIAPRGVFLPDRVVVDVEGDTFPSTKLDDNGRDEAILSSSTFEELKQQVAEGQRLVDADPPGAFRAFRAALELLPEPVQNWNAAGWLLVAMGECAIRTGDFSAALAPLKDAMHCPGTIGNPWVHLRLGQCRLELGDERAADELARAYMGGGRALFEGVDPKCFALVEAVLKPPPGHDRLP